MTTYFLVSQASRPENIHLTGTLDVGSLNVMFAHRAQFRLATSFYFYEYIKNKYSKRVYRLAPAALFRCRQLVLQYDLTLLPMTSIHQFDQDQVKVNHYTKV